VQQWGDSGYRYRFEPPTIGTNNQDPGDIGIIKDPNSFLFHDLWYIVKDKSPFTYFY
jgi:hypothetical protein